MKHKKNHTGGRERRPAADITNYITLPVPMLAPDAIQPVPAMPDEVMYNLMDTAQEPMDNQDA